MSLPYIFLCFPRDKRLTVYQQIEANEHARYMYQFMEQRREQFKMQQQATQMQEFHGQQWPNRFHCEPRQHKNYQLMNVNYQPSRQAPVIAAKPIISQYQPKHQPSRQVSVKAAKPFINQCHPKQQPKHQPKNSNYQTSIQAPVKATCQRQQKKPIKVPSDSENVDSGVGSSVNSGNRSPVKLVPNPFYTGPPVSATTISPTGVKLVPNPFYTGPPTTCKPIVSPTGVKLVPNPFYQCPV
uniref:Uncharacterized protein n=1 Tax=Caenorhabditis japonica TaxID=281687 RepID=A0A8R1EKS8_CAEJA